MVKNEKKDKELVVKKKNTLLPYIDVNNGFQLNIKSEFNEVVNQKNEYNLVKIPKVVSKAELLAKNKNFIQKIQDFNRTKTINSGSESA